MDIEQIHRKLAQAILSADRAETADTKAFVSRFVAALPVGAETLPTDLEAELEAWLNRGLSRLRTGIGEAIQIGGAAGLMTDALAARLAEEAYQRQWPDGLKLSDRLWNWRSQTKAGVGDALSQGIRQMRGVTALVYDMQRAVEAATGNRFDIVNHYQSDWVEELASSAFALIHDPAAKAQWGKTVGEMRKHISALAESGTRPAAERVLAQMLAAVKSGNADLVADSLRWWIYDRQLYNLKRIARTEMANAGHNAIIDATLGDESIIGYQWRLSASHPRPDICDYYASVEMGMGKGVWTKEAVPRHKAHPHCMCLLVPRVTPVRATGVRSYADFVRNATPERQAQLLPKWAREAISGGVKLDDLIRPDGLGLVGQPKPV